jgi:histidine triad (HIT) family protein
VASGEIPAEVMASNDRALGFADINPVAPTHVLIISRHHINSMAELDQEDPGDQSALIDMIALARQLGSDHPQGWRLVTNIGPDGGQSVGHLHLHFLAGRSFSWPPG